MAFDEIGIGGVGWEIGTEVVGGDGALDSVDDVEGVGVVVESENEDAGVPIEGGGSRKPIRLVQNNHSLFRFFRLKRD